MELAECGACRWTLEGVSLGLSTSFRVHRLSPAGAGVPPNTQWPPVGRLTGCPLRGLLHRSPPTQPLDH